MAYSEGLAQRLQEYFQKRTDVEAKMMFGGLCFMIKGHMRSGIVRDTLMLRVGPEQYEACLKKPHAREMDFTGRAMKGMVYVSPEGIESDAALGDWVGIAESFVATLPDK